MPGERSSSSHSAAIGGGRVEIAGLTDRGTVREQNQDVWTNVDGPEGAAECVLLLADGMGGHRGGLEAAQAAVEGAVGAVRASAHPAEALPDIVSAAVRGVDAVRRSIGGEPGTTLVIAVVAMDQAWIAHVGDSRAYLIRDGHARLLTRDHSWAGEEVAAGRLSEAEARHHPRRNMITRAVLGDPVNPDLLRVDVETGDTVLLCSDGLWEPLDDSSIATLLAGDGPLETALAAACDAALAAGSRDNVTLVAARWLSASDTG
ncbi:MAG: PP2C family serine/threonine-protein phosphatase [Candidatus Dormibacteria bacterium]